MNEFKEALLDRIKTPLIGSFAIILVAYNFPLFQNLAVSLSDATKTENAYTKIIKDISICWPIIYSIIYVVLTGVIKIINTIWDELVNIMSSITLDYLSRIKKTENLITIDTLRARIRELERLTKTSSESFSIVNNRLRKLLKDMQYQSSHPSADFSSLIVHTKEILDEQNEALGLLSDEHRKPST